jgi:DNA-binding MarR family transcriptional regulator
MGKPTWLDEDEMRAWMAFIAAGPLLDRRLDQQLRADAGISHLQYVILARLAAAPQGALRMTELADALSSTKSGLTYQVTQMEAAGLVCRRSCSSDTRGVLAVITDAGRELLEKAAPGHVAAVRELFIDVLTPGQLAAIADGLGEIARRLGACDKARTDAPRPGTDPPHPGTDAPHPSTNAPRLAHEGEPRAHRDLG